MPPRPVTPCVRVAGAEQQHAALELVLRPLPRENRGPLLETVGASDDHALAALQALVVAVEGRGVTAATWAQPMPGGVAALWPPEWRRRRPANAEAVEEALVAHAMGICDAAGVTITQALFENEADPRFAAVEATGFRNIATLEYLGRTVPHADPTSRAPTDELCFEAPGEAGYERLKRIIQRTYVDSLDCPGLGGARPLDEVLTGYRSTGRYDPSHWLIACDAQGDAGVLILAEHPNTDQAELIYMGLAPEARGRGWGRAVVEEAVRRAQAMGVDHLMVAVDRANTPAKRVYEAAGFVAWTQRVVFVRTATQAQRPD